MRAFRTQAIKQEDIGGDEDYLGDEDDNEYNDGDEYALDQDCFSTLGKKMSLENQVCFSFPLFFSLCHVLDYQRLF